MCSRLSTKLLALWVLAALFCACAEGGSGGASDAALDTPPDVPSDTMSQPDVMPDAVGQMDATPDVMDAMPDVMDAAPDVMDATPDVMVMMDATPDVMDAAPDVMDTAPDTAPECEENADCADADLCNGVEVCTDGMCMAGRPVTCVDDGVACTTEACAPATGECVSTPDDSRCAGSQMCDATLGCVAPCSEDPCKLVAPQCGCGDTSASACRALGPGTLVCGEAGTANVGQACSDTTPCLSGLTCGSVGGGVMRCLRYCAGSDANCPGPGARCALSDRGQEVCTVDCDPRSETACGDNAACRIQTAMGNPVTHCIGPAGSGTHSDSCSSSAECRAGYGCTARPGESQRRCFEYCRVGRRDCPFSRTCAMVADIGGTDYGVCL